MRSDTVVPVTTTDEDKAKADLIEYLQRAREDLLWKLEGLSEHDVRRPLVPTGTNLLGLVKHTAGTEAGYLGASFGRPFPDLPHWATDEAEDNADMWATPEESRSDLVALYRRVWAHADATVAALPLDAVGLVPWWPRERREPTLHRVLTHVIAETSRHAGQADIVRELIDGAAGMRAGVSNLPDHDADWWTAHHARVERAAREAGDR